MFISVEDRTRGIRFSYNYSMSFTYSQMVITKQAGNTLYTRSHNLKDHFDAPVFVEYQSQNATFERSVLFKGSRLWNQMSVEDKNIQEYQIFKRKRKKIMLLNVK